jgi:putative oxidoreductase
MLSIVFIPHGSQKLLGLFGGYGFTGTMESFTSNGMPAVLAFLIIMAESLGSLALLFGFFGRFMAFGIFMVMSGAILMVHLHNGFFMNWFGTQKGEGFEFHLLAIGLALVIIIKGSGKFSVDRFLHKLLTK